MTREEVIQNIARELTEYMGPLASVILKDKANEFGRGLDDFPQEKLAELVEEVSFEIQNDRRKVEFQRTALEILREVPFQAVTPRQPNGLRIKREEER